MKLSALLLSTLSVAVISASSCTKKDHEVTPDDTLKPGNEKPTNQPATHPGYCPACGMG